MEIAPDGPPPSRTRARALGIETGTMPPGPTNSIVDVANVSVGHATVWFDEPPPPAGRGVARTGVTAVVPFTPGELFEARVPVGVAVLNGAGELTGTLQAQEWGSLETPVLLTRTMAVGRVFDGVVEVMLAADAAVGSEDVVIPTVGECDDSWLSEGRAVQVESADAARAIADARGADAGPVAEGSVGAGTGMVCLGFKGGIGSASREVPPTGYRLGALVLANFGDGASLTVDGVPVGRDFVAEGWKAARDEPEGSCIVVLATDAPLSSRQLQRLATRAGLGLARTGSVAHHGSGEIFLAFSTGARMSRTPETNILHRNLLRDEVLNPFFAAAVEATEEAVVNCLVAADTVSGRDGHVATGIPLDRLTSIMRRHGRLN
ncbi:MAG: P1 family peptidase [Acidimicrobiia bacterium]